MEKKFNQQKYQQKYAKENYSVWKANLKKDIKRELDNLIKLNGYNSNTEFLLKCIDIFKNENNLLKKD